MGRIKDGQPTMRLNPWRLIVPLAIAGVALILVVLRGTAPASCSEASAGLRAGLLTGAQKEYASILRSEPESSCARDGLQALVTQRCSRAKLFAQAGAKRQAEKLYGAVLDFEPADLNVDCALAGLAALPAGAPRSLPSGGEVDDPDPDDPEAQEREVQDAERQDAEVQQPEAQESERQDLELQESERQEPEFQDAERQEPELQEAERQEAERQEAEVREQPRRPER